jgi:hypothetical protein
MNTNRRAQASKKGVYGPTSFVVTVARLFPNAGATVNSLRTAVARNNMNAAQAAVYKLMMTANNSSTTARLLGAWRAYQNLHKANTQRPKGKASAQLRNFQRQFGINRRSAPVKRKAPGKNRARGSNFNRLPPNVLNLITAHLNRSTSAKLSTALGKRVPDPDNMKELGDIVYAAAKLVLAKRVDKVAPRRTMGERNFQRFGYSVHIKEHVSHRDGIRRNVPEARLQGRNWTVVLIDPFDAQEFEVYRRGTKWPLFLCDVSRWKNDMVWYVYRDKQSLPRGARTVLKRELERASRPVTPAVRFGKGFNEEAATV